jgi:hypothetical protein
VSDVRLRHAPGIDSAEEAAQVRREDVGDVRCGCGHAAYSVADASPTSQCTTTSSAEAAPAGRAREAHSAYVRSNCGRSGSCRLLPPLDQAPQRVRFTLLLVRHDPDETDLVATASSVATAVALGL